MPQVDYVAVIRDESHPANEIAQLVLDHRMDATNNCTEGMNVAGYIAYDSNNQQVAVSIRHSSGQGLMSNTHPDQRCLDEITTQLVNEKIFTQKNTGRPICAQDYKSDFQSNMHNSQLKIVFFSELSPCSVKNTNSCEKHIKNILGESFSQNNVYYSVAYEISFQERKIQMNDQIARAIGARHEQKQQENQQKRILSAQQISDSSTTAASSSHTVPSSSIPMHSQSDSDDDNIRKFELERAKNDPKRKRNIQMAFGSEAAAIYEKEEKERRKKVNEDLLPGRPVEYDSIAKSSRPVNDSSDQGQQFRSIAQQLQTLRQNQPEPSAISSAPSPWPMNYTSHPIASATSTTSSSETVTSTATKTTSPENRPTETPDDEKNPTEEKRHNKFD